MHRIHCQPLQLIFSDKLYPCPPAGVALGLAWTSMGGSTLYIETLGQVRQKLLSHHLTLPLLESQRGWDRWRCRTDRKSWWCDEGEHKDRRHLCQVAKDTKDGLDTEDLILAMTCNSSRIFVQNLLGGEGTWEHFLCGHAAPLARAWGRNTKGKEELVGKNSTSWIMILSGRPKRWCHDCNSPSLPCNKQTNFAW